MRSLFLFAIFCCYCTCSQQKQIAADIPELEYLNTDINPCDNFYDFTCGNFKNIHPRPEKEPVWDHFTILQQEILNLAKEILQSDRLPNEPIALQKAKAFYSGCKDVTYMQNLGTPQLAILDKLGKWPAISANFDVKAKKLSWYDMAEITSEYGLSFLLSFTTMPALLNATSNAILIQRDTLLIPEASGVRAELPIDSSDYLYSTNEDGQSEGSPKLVPYMEFLKSIAFRLRDLTHEFKSDEKIVAELEDTLEYMRTVEDNGVLNPNGTIPPFQGPEVKVSVLQNWTDICFGEDFLDWVTYLNVVLKPGGAEVTEDSRVLVTNYINLYGILNLYKISTTRQLKNYVMTRLFTHMAPDSDRFMREAWKKFTELKNGVIYDRDDYCVRKTVGFKGNIDFSLAVTYEYQTYHFNVNKLEKAGTMVENLQTTFLEMLDDSMWMDAESKEKAKKKALKMITLLGYPEESKEVPDLNEFYDDVRVCTWDHFGNAQRLRAFGHADSLKGIGHGKIRDVWTRSPLEVNAFYNRGYNHILLPVSILNPVFFQGDYSVVDYARIGAIIGHEITHGFDDDGHLYTEDGVMGSIWSVDTQKAFTEKTACFMNQYSNYHIQEIDSYVNGEKTLNENLADNGGLRAAYQAFKKLNANNHTLPQGTSYTPEQLFFIGYGTMWCMEETNEYLDAMNKNGTYSPGRFRVIGSVSNMKEFSDAFQCPMGSNMNPTDKCVLW